MPERSALVLAVDLGGTHVRTALSDRDLHLMGRTDEPTRVELGPDGVIEQIVRQAKSSARMTGAGWDQIAVAAVGSPGPVDAAAGLVLGPPNLPGWGRIPLRAIMEEALGTTVKIANDANAAALAEFHRGAGRGSRNFVYLTVSTGIGGGVVVDGRLMEGSSGTAGEIGHMTIDRFGPMCKCGNRGCLEAISSGTAIARRFREQLAAGRTSSLQASPSGSEVTAGDIARAAGEGDCLAREVFKEAGEGLGFGVINCIHIFNPDVVALGGGVTKAGSLVFEPMQRIIDAHALPVPRAAARIVPTELGDDIGLIGAAALAWT